MRQSNIAAIVANADRFANSTRPLDRYFRYLVEELGELSAAMNCRHEHPPALELIQMGGIILNMLERYSDDDIRQALELIEAKHG